MYEYDLGIQFGRALNLKNQGPNPGVLAPHDRLNQIPKSYLLNHFPKPYSLNHTPKSYTFLV